MWWGKGSDKPPAPTAPAEPPKAESSPAEAPKSFDPSKLPEREKLNPNLQKIIDKADKEDNFFDELVSGYAPDSTESNVRYAAYATRIRTILLSAQRYVAYTSDIGESFRPVAHPWLVRGAYGVSWAYVLGDVSYEGYKAYWQNQLTLNPLLELTPRQQKAMGMVNPTPGSVAAAIGAPPGGGGELVAVPKPGVVTPLEDYRTVMAQRAIFQTLASMGLPAFTIHSVVRYSGQAMKNMKNKTIRTWGPIGLGLAIVPFLPSIFDKPVENAVEWVFHKGFESVGGRGYVGDAPTMGREKDLIKKKSHKEKEL